MNKHNTIDTMKKLLIATLLGLLILPLTSCQRTKERMREKIRFERVVEVRPSGLTGLEIDVAVSNDSGHKLRLEEAHATLFYRESEVGTLRLAEPVELERRTATTLTTRWLLDLKNPLAALAAVAKIGQQDLSLLRVSLVLNGRGGPMPVTILREKMPLSDFLNTFGVEATDLTKLIQLR